MLELLELVVDEGFMLIELRLMKDDVSVVDRLKFVFVADLVEIDEAVVDDGFVASR